ncbi:MAG TPA: GNAT family N-acetyltransferase [Acidimicrobiales bacterium]|nr:GNAT family N-acetyltransferase [Acidimicrobiales bacterium]
MPAEPVIRDAVADDLPAISGLYNALIPSTTVAWTEWAETIQDRRAWFAARTGSGDATLVAEAGEGGVIGYAAYGPFRDNVKWPGYRWTVEHTIHVDGDWHGKGVGRALLEALVDRARAQGMHVMIGALDGANEASIRFHVRLGFEVVARLPEVGRKFDRWLDLVLVERKLD